MSFPAVPRRLAKRTQRSETLATPDREQSLQTDVGFDYRKGWRSGFKGTVTERNVTLTQLNGGSSVLPRFKSCNAWAMSRFT